MPNQDNLNYHRTPKPPMDKWPSSSHKFKDWDYLVCYDLLLWPPAQNRLYFSYFYSLDYAFAKTKQQAGKQSKRLPARHSSPTITLLSISHRSEDFWVLPFNSFSAKPDLSRTALFSGQILMGTCTLSVKQKRNFLAGVIWYCMYHAM